MMIMTIMPIVKLVVQIIILTKLAIITMKIVIVIMIGMMIVVMIELIIMTITILITPIIFSHISILEQLFSVFSWIYLHSRNELLQFPNMLYSYQSASNLLKKKATHFYPDPFCFFFKTEFICGNFSQAEGHLLYSLEAF